MQTLMNNRYFMLPARTKTQQEGSPWVTLLLISVYALIICAIAALS